MKVIIYFGHHKVGSTALQAFLANNALQLLQQGILYPAVESQGSAHMLALATGRRRAPDLNCMNLREPHNALAFRMLAQDSPKKTTPPWHGALPPLHAMLRAIRHQVEILVPDTVILCSEVFSNFGPSKPALIAQLKKQFPDADFELYCTLRRPDDYMASWFGQRLRFGRKLDALDHGTALADTRSIHFDYQKMIAPWVAAFPDAKLHLRNYAEVLAAGGSVQDFTTQVGCQFPRNVSYEGPNNQGLPRSSYEIVRRAFHDLPTEQANMVLQFFLRRGKSLTPVPDKKVELYGADLRQQLADQFDPINRYLGTLIQTDQFFEDLDQMRQPRPVSLDDANRSLLQTLTTDIIANDAIYAHIQSLKKEIGVA